MSRIICVALLLIVVVNSFCDSSANHADFHVTKEHIRKCMCRVVHKGRPMKCRFSLKTIKKQDLIKCFCSKTNQHKFPEFQASCKSWPAGRGSMPMTML